MASTLKLTGEALFICTVFLMSSPGSCQTSDDVKALLTNRFQTNSYNKVVRPRLDQTAILPVGIDLFLAGSISIDEVKGKMYSSAYVSLFWTDEHLTWSPSIYNGLHTLHVPPDTIWKPDIILRNGFTKLEEFGSDFLMAKVGYDGEVIWAPFETFETTCDVEISSFPFDIQTCNVTFDVFSYKIDAVILYVGFNSVDLELYSSNGEWELLSAAHTSGVSNIGSSYVTFSFTLKRRSEYYIFTIGIPVMFLSLLSVFTFVIPLECGEKLGFCMSVYLTFAVFLTLIESTHPITPTQSILNQYVLFLVAFGSIIVIVTAFQLRMNYLDTKYRRIPSFLKSLVIVCRKLQCQNRVSSANNNNRLGGDVVLDEEVRPKEERENVTVPENITWQEVTSAIDFVCFWLFLVIIVVASCSFFLPTYFKNS
ncbi:neuronal acetylcholine receptor subunit beta-3-like [Ylistrum balloti]|uniref:neuronal acetylcholine receptor subunit beta-3-like n=1 Tax=Ylistrum balloti TaxID=509963 RepID=UPI002905B33F|nr:neuronal acetylcholine receptor subunit beta-3-like [Ylistrum balloti]